MNKRMLVLLGLLAGVGIFIAIDSSRKPESAVVEMPKRAEQALLVESLPVRAQPPAKQLGSAAASAAEASAVAEHPVPDIFASAKAPVVAEEKAAVVEVEPVPFRLLGFREEDQRREAYLLHDGAVVLVSGGTVLGNRYQILALHKDSVQIRDRQSGQVYQISFGVNE